MILIRFSLLSSNPVTLLDTVHPLSDTEPIIGKSRKVENPDPAICTTPYSEEALVPKFSKFKKKHLLIVVGGFTNPEYSLNKIHKKHIFVMLCSPTSAFRILFYGILFFIMKTRCYKQTNIVVCMSHIYHSAL